MYAVFLLDNENWAEAETIYKELVAEQKFRSLVQKEKAQIYWEAGQAQFQRGLLSEAIQTWQQIEGWQKDSHMVSSIKMARERLKEQQEVRNTRAQRYKS